MKKFIALASAYLGRVGFYFLLTLVVFSLIAQITGSSTVNLVLVWSALMFGALLGLANGVFSLKFLGIYAVKLIVHGILAVASFALSFVLCSGVIESGRSAVWSIFLFAVFMTVMEALRGIIHALATRKENANKSYDYLYTAKE